MGKRNEAVAFILKYFKRFDEVTGAKQYEFYKEYFDGLSNEECDKLFASMRRDIPLEKREVIGYTVANLANTDIPKKLSLAVGKELGINFFQQLILYDQPTDMYYKTIDEYLVYFTIVRIQAQLMTLKRAVASSDNHVNTLTGQATGSGNKTATMTYQEIQKLSGQGFESVLHEITNARGGNELQYREFRRSLLTTGTVSLEELDKIDSRPTSVETAKAFLLGQHFDNNL